MSRFKIRLIIKMLFLTLLSVTGGWLLAYGSYWICVAVFLVAVVGFVHVYLWATRAVTDIKRLISAIRYSEINISFDRAVEKGLPEELAIAMERSINRFKEKLLETETEYLFYDTLLQRIDSGILVIEDNEHIRWINKTAVDIFGKPQPRKLSDLRHVSSDLPVVLEKMVPREIKLVKILKENEENQYALTVTYFNARGKGMKLVNLKNIQPALETHESESWRKLIRVLTHEMMNSITPIISLAETLSDAPAVVDEKSYTDMVRAMKTIHRRSKGLMDFVQNYRRLMQIPEPVLAEVPAREMIADIHHLLRAEGIHFTSVIHPENIHLHVDRAQIEQVLINLIKNAHEAAGHQNLPEIQVRVSQNEYRKPLIEISDNGCGIVPEVMDKVFVPFFTTKTSGSGIGLSICRQIMNLHQGNISIRSEPDQGTTVILLFA